MTICKREIAGRRKPSEIRISIFVDRYAESLLVSIAPNIGGINQSSSVRVEFRYEGVQRAVIFARGDREIRGLSPTCDVGVPAGIDSDRIGQVRFRFTEEVE